MEVIHFVKDFSELLVVVAMFYRGMRALDAFMEIMKQFPPHLHGNDGSIRYPKGMSPGEEHHA